MENKNQKIEAQKPQAHWQVVVGEIDKEIESGALPGIQKKEVSIYVGYYLNGNKICGINKSKNFKFFAFHPEARQLKYDGLTPITDKEAKQKHYGKVTALYTGASLEIPIKLLKLHIQ